MAKKTGDVKEMGCEGQDGERSFEQDLKRLEEIVRALEAGDMPLDKGLELYEEGLMLSKRCGKKLDITEAKIQTLIEQDGKVEKKDYSA